MRKLRNVGIMAVAATSIWAATASGGSSSSSSTTGASGGGSTTAPADTPGIGQPASDGKFTFTVNSVKCGIPSVGDTTNGLGATAQGQFCDVNLKIAEQASSESQDYLASFSTHSVQRAASIRIRRQPRFGLHRPRIFAAGINPGNSITTDIYYDIPTSSSIAKFELHDSPFSNGVTVLNKGAHVVLV